MNQSKKSIRLLRDVEANMVPSGDKVTLAEGNLVQITQSLGCLLYTSPSPRD